MVSLDQGRTTVNVVSGNIGNSNGAFDSITGVTLGTIWMKDKSTVTLRVPEDHTILFYVIRGEMYVNATQVQALQLVEFSNDGEMINISAGSDSVILFGHALPLNEPVVARGPFVMNTEEEIAQAYADLRNGKFGVL